ncbi:EAL domain-containing protein [Hydrogenimonas sp.]
MPIGNIKYKLLVLFLIPAVGMLYFSFGYVRDKFRLYHNVVYLDTVSSYVESASSLIEELQKERGLSIAATDSNGFFKKELEKQRSLTARAFQRFASLVDREQRFFKNDRIKKILLDYSKLEAFREKIDAGSVSMYDILRRYGGLVSELIESTGMLKSTFINEDFFYLVNGYANLLKLSENSGQQRALVSRALFSKNLSPRLEKLLYRLEAEAESLYKTIKNESSVQVLNAYIQSIPGTLEERYRNIREKIVYEKAFDVIDIKSWWKLSTDYIDRLFRADEKILFRLKEMKRRLKAEADRELIIASVLWIMTLLAMYGMILLFTRMLDAYEREAESAKESRKLYKAFSEVLSMLIYTREKRAIWQAVCAILYQTGRFNQVWIGRCADGKIEVVHTENTSRALIEKELNEKDGKPIQLKHEITRAVETGQYEIVVSGNDPSPIYKNTEAFGIFPIPRQEDESCVLVVGTSSQNMFDAEVIDMLGRIVDTIGYVFESIAMRKKEEAMKRELSLMAYAFDTQEAITITDEMGRIVKVNKAFSHITGYEPSEVIGKSPSVLKSGIHDREFYSEMWSDIRKHGYWKGEIFNKRKNGEIYPELLSISAVKDHKSHTSHYVAHFFDTTELKEAQKHAEYRAQHDPLTGLLNRQKLLEELERVYRDGKESGIYSAFLFFDLDNFKQINDNYGHHVGDLVLAETAARLESLAREGDIVARIAGDEFAFISVHLDSDKSKAIEKVSILLEKIRSCFQKPMEVDGQRIEVSFSIGVKIFPDKEKSADEVMMDADVAMYHAKKNGRNQHRFFDDQLDLESRQFLALRDELTQAIKREELQIYYQPQVWIENDKIRGFEALIRWNHPRKGLLEPEDFLHVTSSNRLDDELANYTITKVCQDLLAWEDAPGGFEGKISVNISTEQFWRPDFTERISHMIEKSGVDPKRLEFEVVEDALMQNIEYSIDIINHFRSLGIQFSIDDFGTGYSSINYLKRLPVDTLKIDKSFVSELFDANNKEIVRLIVEMTKIFKMTSIAVGVDDHKVLEFLKECGCDCYQGYIFSHALPAEKAMKLINR